MIKHVSFDLWNTLFKSNPLFKQERIVYIHKKYNPLGLSVNEVKDIIQSVDVMCNSVNESTGKNISAIEMYAMVLYQMGCSFDQDKLWDLVMYSNMLFTKYLPTLFPNTLNSLIELRKNGISISILSNTGFIEGKIVKMALTLLEVNQYVDFCIFSDEEGMSKPNLKLFEKVFFRTARKWENRKQILHVGDSVIADVNGAKNAGFSSMQITTNSLTIKDVLNEVLRPTQCTEPKLSGVLVS